MSPIAIGLVTGAVCSYAVKVNHKAGYDDALDVVGVHFVGGLLGSILIGFCADPDFFGAEFGKGIFFGGRPDLLFDLLFEQLLANGVTIVYSFVLTFAIMKALDAVMGVRVSEDVEEAGLDQAEHAETAYNLLDASFSRN